MYMDHMMNISKLVGSALPGTTMDVTVSGGEAVVSSRELPVGGEPGGQEEKWYVAYVSVEDAPREGGREAPRIMVRYREEFPTAFAAGKEFGELTTYLPGGPPDPSIPPQDPVERKVWKQSRRGVRSQIGREMALEELKEEAQRLKNGQTDYPPEESVLYEILKEVDALSGKDRGEDRQ